MNKRILVISSLLLALGFLGANAHAMDVHATFNELDKDSNGMLTQDEVNISPELASAFVEIDADSNGDIDMSEYVLYHSPATAAGTPETPENIEAAPAD